MKFFLFLIPLIFCSCLYRAPTDDDFCTNPNFNNPHIIGEKSQDMLQGPQ